MKRKTHTLIYKLLDVLAASVVWAIFFLYRKFMVEGSSDWSEITGDVNFWLGIWLIPLGWSLFYHLFDKTSDIYRLSRLSTLVRTFFLSFFGVLFLFFTLVLDDVVQDYTTYYTSFFVLFITHFLVTGVVRLIFLSWAKKQLRNGNVAFRTIMIGGGKRAVDLFDEIQKEPRHFGYKIVGFIQLDKGEFDFFKGKIPKLGTLKKLPKILQQQQLEEVIIAIDQPGKQTIRYILRTIYDSKVSVIIKIIPDLYDILLGSVKMQNVFGAALIEIKQDLQPAWQRVVKRLIDVVVSAVVLFVLSPFLLFIAWKVRRSSPGPLFYKQERIGFNNKPFHIIKFRSMYIDAEKMGPQLSSENDPRITPWGIIMRKYRLDELPNFWNVLIGDMSLVGPRPERQFYINQIVTRAPHYLQLLKVRPGITSWGQVKYGYASNVDEMLDRLKYDLLYIENMSLILDLKILIYTVMVILQGRGK